MDPTVKKENRALLASHAQQIHTIHIWVSLRAPNAHHAFQDKSALEQATNILELRHVQKDFGVTQMVMNIQLTQDITLQQV